MHFDALCGFLALMLQPIDKSLKVAEFPKLALIHGILLSLLI